MSTIIELDRRYRSEKLAGADTPLFGQPGWYVVPCDLRPGEFRLRLEVQGGAPREARILQYLRKQFPLYTFRVIASDGGNS